MPERLATIAENMLQVPLPSTKQPKIQHFFLSFKITYLGQRFSPLTPTPPLHTLNR